MQGLRAQAEAPPTPGEDAAIKEGNIKEEEYPGEPVRVDGELWLPLGHWAELAVQLSY
jgi:hypothetical protein